MRAFRWMILALLACGAGVALLARSGAIALPDRYDPWAPLDIQAEPNLLTRLKLGRRGRAPMPHRAGEHWPALHAGAGPPIARG